MIKFKLLGQFPGDHLVHTVVSSHIFLLCEFAAFAYNAIACFVSTGWNDKIVALEKTT